MRRCVDAFGGRTVEVRRPLRTAGQVVEVTLLGLVQVQCPADGVGYLR
jgi:hypothetical protein